MNRERLDIVVDLVKNDRQYTFGIPYGVQYQDVYDVLAELGAHVKDMERRTKEAAEKAQADAPSAEVPGEVSNG